MEDNIIVTLKRSNDLLMTFGNDYSDVFLPAIDEIVRLRKALREIYEVYANSEGIPQPMTAAEGYLLFLLKETAKIAQETLQEKE
jgi:hypothetical protein